LKLIDGSCHNGKGSQRCYGNNSILRASAACFVAGNSTMMSSKRLLAWYTITKLSIAVPLSQKRGYSKWRIQGSARQSMIEGINGRLVMPQLILAFTEPIVGLYG